MNSKLNLEILRYKKKQSKALIQYEKEFQIHLLNEISYLNKQKLNPEILNLKNFFPSDTLLHPNFNTKFDIELQKYSLNEINNYYSDINNLPYLYHQISSSSKLFAKICEEKGIPIQNYLHYCNELVEKNIQLHKELNTIIINIQKNSIKNNIINNKNENNNKKKEINLLQKELTELQKEYNSLLDIQSNKKRIILQFKKINKENIIKKNNEQNPIQEQYLRYLEISEKNKLIIEKLKKENK